ENEHSVEVVELVLDDPGVEILQLDPDRRAPEILRLQRQLRRPLDRDEHALEREAPLVRALAAVARRGHDRIDEGDGLGVLVLAEPTDEHAPDDADLGRRQADAVRIGHQHVHTLGQPAEVVVEHVDLCGLHPQRRVGVLADLREGEATPRFLLRISLLARLLFEDLPVLLGHEPSVLRPGPALAQRLVGAAAASGAGSSAAAMRTLNRRAQTTAPTNATAAPTIAALCRPDT